MPGEGGNSEDDARGDIVAGAALDRQVQQEQGERKPGRGFKDRQLEGRVRGEVSSKRKRDRADQRGDALSDDPFRKKVRERAREHKMQNRFQLQVQQGEIRAAERDRADGKGKPDRIVDRALHIRQERMPAVELFRPQRQTPGGKGACFVQAECPELVGEIAGGKGSAVRQFGRNDAPEEQQRQRRQEGERREIARGKTARPGSGGTRHGVTVTFTMNARSPG